MPYPPPTPQTFAVEDAWKPLPLGHWRIDTAQHWLRRVGFAAPPEAVTAALRKSPDDCWEAAFLPGGATMPKPEELAEFEATVHERYREIHQSVTDPKNDLQYSTDFRGIYSSVLDKWLEADSSKILGERFDHVPFI